MPAHPTLTDTELVVLLSQNDQAALKLIYQRYWKKLYLSAFSILRDTEQSEDIVQDVLLKLWIRKHDVEISSLKSYLFTAVRYKVCSYIRSADNRKVFLEPGELEQIAGIEDLKDRLNEKDINDLLEQGIASLPERCRQVFLLSRREYFSNKQIADKMNISIKTVEAQITIALKILRLNMGDVLFWICVMMSFICQNL